MKNREFVTLVEFNMIKSSLLRPKEALERIKRQEGTTLGIFMCFQFSITMLLAMILLPNLPGINKEILGILRLSESLFALFSMIFLIIWTCRICSEPDQHCQDLEQLKEFLRGESWETGPWKNLFNKSDEELMQIAIGSLRKLGKFLISEEKKFGRNSKEADDARERLSRYFDLTKKLKLQGYGNWKPIFDEIEREMASPC